MLQKNDNYVLGANNNYYELTFRKKVFTNKIITEFSLEYVYIHLQVKNTNFDTVERDIVRI